MIRRLIIVLLTLAAVMAFVIFVLSYDSPIHLGGRLTSHRHVCMYANEGTFYLHYVFSNHEPFLERIDPHEFRSSTPRWTGFMTYGEDDHSVETVGPPDPNERYVPTVTYAWSRRVGLPFWVVFLLLAGYPGVTAVRGLSYRRDLGFDRRIAGVKTRMLVTTIAGSVIVIAFSVAISFIADWFTPTYAMSLWLWLAISFASLCPGIFVTIWLFWRLTPGDHGGPLWRRRQRLLRERGLCPHCGYDLRGSPDRCPECGKESAR